MQTITRKLGDFKPLVFKIDLSDYGKDANDIEDIICSIKSDITDLDDALFIKKYSLGEINYTGLKSLIINVEWLYTEYGNLPIGEYDLGLFVKFVSDPLADENVSQTFKVAIIQDFLQQN